MTRIVERTITGTDRVPTSRRATCTMKFSGYLGVWMWVGGILAPACATDDFTAEERVILESFALGPLPSSPSNAVADDQTAAALGQQFFFDPRFSGPLKV